jgi:hypothetical protein
MPQSPVHLQHHVLLCLNVLSPHCISCVRSADNVLNIVSCSASVSHTRTCLKSSVPYCTVLMRIITFFCSLPSPRVWMRLHVRDSVLLLWLYNVLLVARKSRKILKGEGRSRTPLPPASIPAGRHQRPSGQLLHHTRFSMPSLVHDTGEIVASFDML